MKTEQKDTAVQRAVDEVCRGIGAAVFEEAVREAVLQATESDRQEPGP